MDDETAERLLGDPDEGPEVGNTIVKRAFDGTFYNRIQRAEDYRYKSFLGKLLNYRGTAVEVAIVPACTALAIGVLVAYLKTTQPDLIAPMSISTTSHSIMIIPVAFLLVVRTQIAYDRFWSGRVCISEIMSHSRGLSSKAMNYIKGDSPQAKKARVRFFQYTLAFWISIRHNLMKRSQRGVRGKVVEYAGYLAPEETKFLKQMRRNRPIMISEWMRRTIAECETAGLLRSQELIGWMDRDVTALMANWTSANGICNAPMPYPYAHLLSFLLHLWIASTPFALVDRIGNVWVLPVMNFLVAVTLFGINGIGSELEDPFGDDFNDIPMEYLEMVLHDDLWYLAAANDPDSMVLGDPMKAPFNVEDPFSTSRELPTDTISQLLSQEWRLIPTPQDVFSAFKGAKDWKRRASSAALAKAVAGSAPGSCQ